MLTMTSNIETNRPERNMTRARPKGKRRAQRRKNTQITDYRNILSVYGVPEDKVVRWVMDSFNGARLHYFQQMGWEFVPKDRGVSVGETRVEPNSEIGNVVTKVAGRSDTTKMYLMMIDKDLYEERQAEKQKEVDASEEAIYKNLEEPGKYGEFKQEVRHTANS